MNVNEIIKELETAGYIANREIGIAVSGAVDSNVPILIEGAPGVGKTSLAKAVAQVFKMPLLRIQFYEGLTYDKILYDYDYQRQLLTINTMQGALMKQMDGKSLREAGEIAKSIDFYGAEFLIKRPVVQAFSGEERYVLLLDEVDKSSEEIEYTLLEALDEYSVTIPQYGTIQCPEDKKPVIFLTSNNYRELSEALRRRCGYLYLEQKTPEETKEILVKKAGADEKLATAVAKCLSRIQELPLKKAPSIAEAVMWTNYLTRENLTVNSETLDDAIYLLIKNNEDRRYVKENIGKVVSI